MKTEDYQNVLTMVMNRFNREIDAILELGKTSPKLVLDNMDAINSLKFLIDEVKVLHDALADLEVEMRVEKSRRVMSLRWQKHWRIIACKACMGGANIDMLLNQAFLELVTEPPTEEQLDEELERIADQLEQLERGGQDTKALRVFS